MKAAYVDQIRGLIDGGVDLLLLETIIDTLNTKAAIVAIQEVQDEKGVASAADDLGHDHRPQRPHAGRPDARRVLHRHRTRAAVVDRHQLRAWRGRHAAVPRRARAHRRLLGQRVSERRPAQRVRRVRRAAGGNRRAAPATSPTSGFANILGGCCGTTPDHIAAIARAVEGVAPRRDSPPPRRRSARRASSGLEPLIIRPTATSR